MSDSKKITHLRTTDRRGFPRLILALDSEALRSTLGAKVKWSSDRFSDILDISYTGVAIVNDQLNSFECKQGQDLRLKILFGGFQDVEISARVVRISEHKVAFEFTEVPLGSRNIMENFLKYKMLGALMRELPTQSPQVYRWFHGPNDTNVFLWFNGKALDSALIEMNHSILFLSGKHLSEGSSHGYTFDDDELYELEALKRVNLADQPPNRVTVLATLDLLTQVEKNREVFNPLIHKLVDHLCFIKSA